jgi:ribosome recycling factor
MALSDGFVKDLEGTLAGVVGKLKQDLGGIRGNRPSPEMLQDVRVNVYDQNLTIRELGSLSVLPPRTIQITLWDKDAVPAVMKAIESGHMGLTVSNDGVNIRATLSQLGNDRRDEMIKLVKKTTEAARIDIRQRRETTIKQLKDAEARKEITEDDAFKGRERVQKAVDKANKEAEAMMDAKITELGE